MWLTAFLDLPAGSATSASAFWAAVAGASLSPARGEHDEFRTLVPESGAAWLRVQRLDSGPARVHLDLHADDAAGGTAEVRARAERLGARPLHEGRGWATYSSPEGLVFCVVGDPAVGPPRPVDWGEHTSLVDQVCLDIAADRFDDEAAFWAALPERPLQDSGLGEFARLGHRPEDSLLVLLQRCGPGGPARAHLDLATSSREAEVERIGALGAQVVRVTDEWTTLRDPAGLEFCVTDRSPD